MPRKTEPIKLRASARRELKAMSRSASESARLAFRANIILLSADGLANKEIAERLHCTRPIVHMWKKRWKAEGVAGLQDRCRPGRPAELTAAMKRKVVERACKKPPKDLGRWSARTLARSFAMDHVQVHRILREHDIKLHQLRSFTFSPDPKFEEKLLDVVGLYMNPPENAIVLCVDEKTGIQALDRTQPMLPLRARKPRAWTNEYVRHGTRTLLASLDVKTGEVIAHVRKRRTSKDFLSFMDSVVEEYGDKRLCVVLDNLNTHNNKAARTWLQNNPTVSFHFTPTHASWVNLVESFFSILTRQGLQQKAFKGVRQLEKFLKDFIIQYNRHCGPFEWTASPTKLQKIIRLTREYQNA